MFEIIIFTTNAILFAAIIYIYMVVARLEKQFSQLRKDTDILIKGIDRIFLKIYDALDQATNTNKLLLQQYDTLKKEIEQIRNINTTILTSLDSVNAAVSEFIAVTKNIKTSSSRKKNVTN